MHATLINNRLLLLAVLTLALSACGSGPRQVRGELPLVSLDSLERHNGEVTLVLGLRNVNDGSLALNRIGVQLRLNDEALIDLVHTPDLQISARGREVLRLRGSALPEGLAVLEQMNAESDSARERGQLTSAAWQLDVQLIGDRGRERSTQASGFLHPVPGRPDRFR